MIDEVRHSGDRGMTLVELLVALAVSVLVSALLAGLLINGIRTQEQGTARDTATGRANVISASINSSVRNATVIKVASDGMRLDAKVFTSSGGWECRAWALTSGHVVYSSGTTARAASTTGWTVLSPAAAGTLTGGAAFAPKGTRGVSIGLLLTASGETARISDGVTGQAESSAGGGVACF